MLLNLVLCFSMSDDMANDLRNAVAASGQSANEIAKACGIPQTTLSRFLRGEEMSIGRAAKIAAYLGLELKPSKKKE